jgi:predicted nucleic acid-binding Zn ribbon protein
VSSWRRSPRPLELALGPVRDRLAPATALAEVQRHWGEAVGESIAAHASPTAERAGVLTVSCEASVWAHELDLMGPAIVEKLNRLLGSHVVARLRCVTLPGR